MPPLHLSPSSYFLYLFGAAPGRDSRCGRPCASLTPPLAALFSPRLCGCFPPGTTHSTQKDRSGRWWRERLGVSSQQIGLKVIRGDHSEGAAPFSLAANTPYHTPVTARMAVVCSCRLLSTRVSALIGEAARPDNAASKKTRIGVSVLIIIEGQCPATGFMLLSTAHCHQRLARALLDNASSLNKKQTLTNPRAASIATAQTKKPEGTS